LLEALNPVLERKDFIKRYGLDPGKKILALIPGSRMQEIEKIFPEMLRAGRMIAGSESMEIVVAVAPTLQEEHFRTFYNLDGVHLIKDASHEVMANSDFALVKSGTATLETALLGTPMVVVYKTSWPTYVLGRLLIHVDNIGLVNIVAGKQIVPEFIQRRASASIMAREVGHLLQNEDLLASMRRELQAVKGQLGEFGASKRVAQHILQMV
jgi:lipid-A-disaccharide synthase